MPDFDVLAEHYDQTRGGEPRGDEYAEDIDVLLPRGDDPILEIGVGTGVVALGLAKRGRHVIGIDVSRPMITRAKQRLGAVVAQSDAMEMGVRTGSVAHAVSVWVVHAVPEPERLFAEAARVIRPGGTYVVCCGQGPAEDDEVGQLVRAMVDQIQTRGGAARQRANGEDVLAWAAKSGFTGSVREVKRQWHASPEAEVFAIEHRTWSIMRTIDEAEFKELSRPVIETLRALPATDLLRKSTADLVVLRQDSA